MYITCFCCRCIEYLTIVSHTYTYILTRIHTYAQSHTNVGGGFLPWLGWRYFFLSTFMDPGNGGALKLPSKKYDQYNDEVKEQQLQNQVVNSDDTIQSILDDANNDNI